MGQANASAISYEGTPLRWDANAPTSALVGSLIVGSKARWLDTAKVIFESCQSGTCRLYTYDINTRTCAQVSATGATALFAGGGIWAKYLTGTGYVDSLGRTSATYGVAGVNESGIVLVILNNATSTGLGYLLTTDASVSNTTVICYDILERDTRATFRANTVMFHSGSVLRQYNLDNGNITSSNLPVLLERHDADWITGTHTLGRGAVVVNFTESEGYQLGLPGENYYPDILLQASGEYLDVVTSRYAEENPRDIRRYILPVDPKFNASNIPQEDRLQLVNLYQHSLASYPYISSTTTPPDRGATVVDSDVITIRENIDTNSDRGFAQVISSADWFGTTGGRNIRGSWQYGLTAVVASTNTTAEENVTVKNSSGNTYSSNRTSYGNSAVFIRPSPSSVNTAPLWEVTWVANSTTYSRVTLNANLTNTVAITNATLTFDTAGILDVNATSNVPITGTANEGVWYGYVKLQYPMTRGAWTVGKDVSPTLTSTTERLVAWDSDAATAFVVWNADTAKGTITRPAHLALEFDGLNTQTAAVVVPQQTLLIRNNQWQPLSSEDVRFGRTPGTR